MTPPADPPPARSRVPTLRHERELLRAGRRLVAGVDEVGRGALAGPVTVGVVVVDAATRTAPVGLRDSKLLTPAQREALAPRLRRWAPAWAVGSAEADEIDALGILRALRLAGTRALAQLPTGPDLVLLDGNYDWLQRPLPPPAHHLPPVCPPLPEVVTRIKADLRCAAVAAASVLAKVARDAVMVERSAHHPGYGWAGNKGYSAPDHVDALRLLGPCVQHRRSWRLPGVEDGTGTGGGAGGGTGGDGDGGDGDGDGDQQVLDLRGLDLAAVGSPGAGTEVGTAEGAPAAAAAGAGA